MNSPNAIRFAVAGCGHIGKRHAAIIDQHPECKLTGLCDILPKKALAVDHFDVPFFSSLEQLLREGPECDVVCICTPNGLHAEQCVRALEARRHVVVEKPMALRKSECERIIFKALNVSRQVFCVMQNRYSPQVRWLKEVVSSGRIGEIQMVQTNCFWNRDDRYYRPGGQAHPWRGRRELDGGTLFTQFAHFVDILYWIFGDIRDIRSDFEDFRHRHSTDFEDSGNVQFRFVNGGMGSLVFSTALWDRNFESTITVLGSRGAVKIGGQYMNKVEYCHIQDYITPKLEPASPPNVYQGYTGSAANHHFVIQNVVDVLKGRKEATTNALEGMKVVEIIERIYERRE